MLFNTNQFRFLHISDIHCGQFHWNPLQIFSKRIIGNLNWMINRRRIHKLFLMDQLAHHFSQNLIDLMYITGDISTTAIPAEFENVVSLLNRYFENIPIIGVPGNHDYYIQKAFKEKTFFNYFSSTSQKKEGSFSLHKDRIEVIRLSPSWWSISMDTCLPRPLFTASGKFFDSISHLLNYILKNMIPPEHHIILINHYPLIDSNIPHHDMDGAMFLQELLKKFPQVKLYLHGHAHHFKVKDLRLFNLPIVIDAGSCTHTHRASASRVLVNEEKLTIEQYGLKQDPNQKPYWDISKKYYFSVDKESSSSKNL